MQFDVIVMLIFLATLPQTLNVIFSMEIALRHHRFCDFKYSNLEWATSKVQPWWQPATARNNNMQSHIQNMIYINPIKHN